MDDSTSEGTSEGMNESMDVRNNEGVDECIDKEGVDERIDEELEEHFILRVPPELAARLERVLSQNPSAGNDISIDLSFQEDGRTGSFVIGDDSFSATLFDLPTVVESYKTYDDENLVKTADVGQIIVVGKPEDPASDSVEYRHGITPPMRDARRRRFLPEDPDDMKLNPNCIHQVECDIKEVLEGKPVSNFVNKEILEGADSEEEERQNPPFSPE